MAFLFGHGDDRKQINVELANVGAVPALVTGVVFLVKGKKETMVPTLWRLQTPANLPVTLEPGAGLWTGLLPAELLVGSLNEQYGRRKNWKVRARASVAGDIRFSSKQSRRSLRHPFGRPWMKSSDQYARRG